MTEAEWLAATTPAELIRFTHRNVSERKMRLFAVACCRRVWHLIAAEPSRHAVEISEQYADGGVSLEELETAFLAADTVHSHSAPRSWHAHDAARLAAHPELRGLADGTSTAAAMAASQRTGNYVWQSYESALIDHCGLFRDLVGNPFHPAPVIAASWLKWNGDTVRELATAIYTSRAFDRLPTLADALEDAGCNDATILAHCRRPGDHVRGCWVIDQLLGKK